MSAATPPAGELEIRGGGAVAVDTETLRRTAADFDGAIGELEALVGDLGPLQNMLFTERAEAWSAAAEAADLASRMRDAVTEGERVATALRDAATLYELVETVVAHRAAVLSGDADAARILAARISDLRAEDGALILAAWGAEAERTAMWPGELVRQATELGLLVGSDYSWQAGVMGGAALGLSTVLLASVIGTTGMGRVPAGTRLDGATPPVVVRALPTGAGAASVPPRNLADAASRIPGPGEARVRVEKYTMPDGSRQFAVYVAGTSTAAVGGKNPWDNRSNVELYTGHTSASYAATLQALEDAGAEPGDVVHAFGHSQGAMITGHLAMEGPYATETLVSFGTPREMDVGADTWSMSVRHTDDPAVALSGGGAIAATGAAGSVLVERAADPNTGPHDTTVPAHRLTAYAETAALIDASTDPRIDTVRDVFDELATATDIRATEYAAERAEGPVSPSSGGG
ncbi:hypothetical protein [Microbacterium aurantiacum]|uniref:hypothetical protein n=1 Tax=Microbacterium aurantiacum TaxID=162393 RepID=UPI003F49614B